MTNARWLMASDDDTAGFVANNRLTSGQAIHLGTMLIVGGHITLGRQLLDAGFQAAMSGGGEVRVGIK